MVRDLLRAAITAWAIMVGVISPGQLLGRQPVPLVGMMQAPVQPKDPGGSVNPNDQISLIQWGIREGGAFAVILVILFFYRRDWKTAVDFWRDQHAITTQLVQESTRAQTETAAALRENTTVVHQAKNVLARVLPERRDGGIG